MDTIIFAAVPVFLLCIVLEVGLTRRRGIGAYERRDTWASLAMGAIAKNMRGGDSGGVGGMLGELLSGALGGGQSGGGGGMLLRVRAMPSGTSNTVQMSSQSVSPGVMAFFPT